MQNLEIEIFYCVSQFMYSVNEFYYSLQRTILLTLVVMKILCCLGEIDSS